MENTNSARQLSLLILQSYSSDQFRKRHVGQCKQMAGLCGSDFNCTGGAPAGNGNSEIEQHMSAQLYHALKEIFLLFWSISWEERHVCCEHSVHFNWESKEDL